ncbi:hypothetical protein DERP_000830 [Dermatophagoides pteronyssinus]|uniref:Uncharacterized protein n=1 Tax=Dermatophagoides pteronyssinus TaxID=6956 RepID=A0ABQ8J1T1_DERPT|nr:hypothetical protein DERP_000830 [Dermatophagoides pteronyssinus]
MESNGISRPEKKTFAYNASNIGNDDGIASTNTSTGRSSTTERNVPYGNLDIIFAASQYSPNSYNCNKRRMAAKIYSN